MDAPHPHALLIILFVAALAPLLNEVPYRLRPPLVVIEIVFGVLIGPQVFDLVAVEGPIRSFSALGMSFLFFLAGMELEFNILKGKPLNLAMVGWVVSILVALAVTYGLQQVHLVSNPLLVSVALSTTAIGTLLPILRDSSELESAFGRYVLGAGAIGEFGPIILFSLIFTGEHGVAVKSGLLLAFIFIALACASIAMQLRPPHIVDLLAKTLNATSQLPIRLSVFLLGALVVLADTMGLDLLLGAFAAGSLVGLVSKGPSSEVFRHKLDALGFGFFIPIFFITSGAQVDLHALTSSAGTMARVPLFLGLLLVVRGLPVILYRKVLTQKQRWMLAFYSATGLPLIVVITDIGKATGLMQPENAAALVGAGVISVLLYPLVALMLRGDNSAAESMEPVLEES